MDTYSNKFYDVDTKNRIVLYYDCCVTDGEIIHNGDSDYLVVSVVCTDSEYEDPYDERNLDKYYEQNVYVEKVPFENREYHTVEKTNNGYLVKLGLRIIDGQAVCPDTNTEYRLTKDISNMLPWGYKLKEKYDGLTNSLSYGIAKLLWQEEDKNTVSINIKKRYRGYRKEGRVSYYNSFDISISYIVGKPHDKEEEKKIDRICHSIAQKIAYDYYEKRS